jgi:hypothetical protein
MAPSASPIGSREASLSAQVGYRRLGRSFAGFGRSRVHTESINSIGNHILVDFHAVNLVGHVESAAWR